MGARTHIEPVCTPQVAKAAMDKAWRVYSDKMKNVKVVQDQCTELKIFFELVTRDKVKKLGCHLSPIKSNSAFEAL